MRQTDFPHGRAPLRVLGLCLLLGLAACVGEREVSPASEVPMSTARLEAREADAGLTVETRPDGLQEVNMQGRFQHRVIMRRDADGGLHHECASSKGHPDEEARKP